MDYFSNVFLKNIDIWGFTMIYVPIMEYLLNNYSKLNEHEIQIIQHIKKMLTLILEASTEPISTNKLVALLKDLNKLFALSHRQNGNKAQGLKHRKSVRDSLSSTPSSSRSSTSSSSSSSSSTSPSSSSSTSPSSSYSSPSTTSYRSFSRHTKKMDSLLLYKNNKTKKNSK